MKKSSVGIYATAAYLPEEVRSNEWWSKETVEGWSKRAGGKIDRPAAKEEPQTEGGRIALEFMQRYRDDPFKGSKERRVMPDGMKTSDMEIRAAELAIEKAGIDRSEIDLLLTMTTLPDYLLTPNAAVVHHALGLPRSCYALQTEGGCNSFLMQFALADRMISGGAAKRALLIQSSGTTRLMRPTDPSSAWFGDGATAVVVGPVSDGYGFQGASYQTDGRFAKGLVCGLPGKGWWESGQVHAYLEQPDLARELVVAHIHESKEVVAEALSAAGWPHESVDFYASHQGFAWFREATQAHVRLGHSRALDTFPWAGSLLGANVPLVLTTAEQEGLLGEGDRVLGFATAAGASMSAAAIRWGGR